MIKSRLSGSSLRADLAEVLLRPKVSRLRGRVVTVDEIDEVLKQLQLWVLEPSLNRDDILEDIAWELKLRGAPLALLEDHKSYNPKLVPAEIARAGSVYASIVSRLEPDLRLKLLNYVLHPEHEDFPQAVQERVVEILKDDIANTPAEKLKKSVEPILEQAISRKEEFEDELNLALLNSEPAERIPLIEMLIQAGDMNLPRNGH